MKKKIFVIFFLFIGFNLNAQIIQENKILAKVGAQIITSVIVSFPRSLKKAGRITRAAGGR